ncbi:MAG: aldo/keto reductase [Candidatus Latescibacterota bacterium]|nr:aldo/keto reductase [Candidatus Latescibacterota bacterium]
MQYTTLGETDLRVSEIGLGTWSFNSSVYGPVAESEAQSAIWAAREAGINFFDTAPLYGDAERDGMAEAVLGRGLGGWRDQAVISTKFGRKPTEGNKANFYGAYAVQSVEESLVRLGTDYIDVLFFHSPFSAAEIHDDIWEALAGLQTAGKVRYIGHSISKFQDTEAMARSWARARRIDAVQVVYSLLNREAKKLIAELGVGGIGVVARESLANGFLSGAVGRDAVFPPGSLNARYTREEIVERVVQVERLSFLVRGEVESMAQAALRWVLDDPGIALVLTGAKTAAEVADCAASASATGYAAAELKRANAVHQRDFAAA